ncbi:MAG: hypothetical protein KC609_14855 [Myxococcales bacterium]|nr:hypothetical protein [Myxococcales bacterium]
MSSFVLSSTSLNAFFHSAVSETMKDMGVQASQFAEYYLVELLSTFATTNQLYSGTAEAASPDEPLVLLMKRAIEAPAEKRVQMLRRLGDVSLYISGFFSESLNRKLIDVDYYVSMGRSAYTQVQGLMQRHRHGDVFDTLYGELADKFIAFVEVLAEISDKAAFSNNKDLLAIYERWLKTRSKRLAKKLTTHGVIPHPEADSWSVN